ncbi:hypothetical protein ACFOGJ_07930 [Marinibaculum pumilum]|uniref:Uncharacterized protein n=1 Tax=Marinibaculum pumilum TaxID=1766165 RepID=A0ABV7KXS6_9PROT
MTGKGDRRMGQQTKARHGMAAGRAAGLAAALAALCLWGGAGTGLAADDTAPQAGDGSPGQAPGGLAAGGLAAGADPALLAIVEDICGELMGAERARRRLNSYQLAALPHVAPRDGDGATRVGFFAGKTFYCRRAGMALWATYEVTRLPPQEILALQSPPAVAVEVRFERVAPPAPATEPDRLKAAAESAKGALARVAATRGASGTGATVSGPTGQANAAASGPQPIIPSSLDAVAGTGPAGRSPATEADRTGAPRGGTAPPAGRQ